MGVPENEKLDSIFPEAPPSSGSEKDSIAAEKHHITEDEQAILDRQLEAPVVQASFFMLYRYASRTDLAIIAVSATCAMTAGAAFPLLTVQFSLPKSHCNSY
jgi:hypothetical protein